MRFTASYRCGILAGVVLLVLLFGTARAGDSTGTAGGAPGQRAGFEEGRNVDIYTLLPKDAIRSIDAPEFQEVATAAAEMVDQESVIGVTIGGESRAYPLNVLSRHEIVNDVIGDIPIAVTF